MRSWRGRAGGGGDGGGEGGGGRRRVSLCPPSRPTGPGANASRMPPLRFERKRGVIWDSVRAY
jgi:hypothetical protein